MPERGWQADYRKWLDATSFAGLGLLLFAAMKPSWGVGAGLLFHTLALFTLWAAGRAQPTPADRITQARALGLGVLYLFVLAGLDWPFLLLWAGFMAVLDLFDGWVARRTRATAFGAVFDMETDQLMVTALALFALHLAAMPPWLILFPALRYLHLLALRFAGLPRLDPKPKDGDNTRARFVCAVVVVVLLTNFIPGAETLPRLLLNGFALGLLIWSFADDFVFLFSRFRRRPPA